MVRVYFIVLVILVVGSQALHISDSITCPGGNTTCPDGNTCCLIGSGVYGCCPFPDAECCSYTQCCPKGKICNAERHTCDVKPTAKKQNYNQF